MSDILYARPDGYDRLAMFATNVVDQARQDDLLGRFWANRGDDRNPRELQLLIDYLVRETGGQMYYTGRTMALSHQGMGITGANWARFIETVANVAANMSVGPNEGAGVMAFLNSHKAGIVTPLSALSCCQN